MKILLTLFFLFFSSSLLSEPINVPTVEKIFEERYQDITIPFYGCVYLLEFEDKEDLFDTKKILKSIILGNKNQKVKLRGTVFEGLEINDAKLPKIGDCFAFKPSGQILKSIWEENTFEGYAELYEFEYNVDSKIKKVVLKDELSVDEYFQDKHQYGNKRINLIGVVEKAEINFLDNFSIILVSKNGELIIGYVASYDWQNNESVKKQLRLIEPGKTITVHGYFEGELPPVHTFRVLRIVDTASKDNNNLSLTDEDVTRIDFIISFLPDIEPTANLICTQKVYLENSIEERKNIYNFFKVIKKITQNNINDQKDVENLFKEVKLNMDKVDEINQKFYNCF